MSDKLAELIKAQLEKMIPDMAEQFGNEVIDWIDEWLHLHLSVNESGAPVIYLNNSATGQSGKTEETIESLVTEEIECQDDCINWTDLTEVASSVDRLSCIAKTFRDQAARLELAVLEIKHKSTNGNDQ